MMAGRFWTLVPGRAEMSIETHFQISSHTDIFTDKDILHLNTLADIHV